jgi:hypothetical protein
MKVLGAMLIVFVLAIGIAAFFSWRMANQPPEWWHPLNPADPQVDRAARSVENRVSDQVHRARGGGSNAGAAPATWTLSISDDDANAWLAARLQEWLANRSETLRWPANASDPQVLFEEGQIQLGFEVSEGGKGRVVSASLRPRIDEGGALWIQLDRFAIGRFALPGSTVVDAGGTLLESKLPPEIRNNPDTKNFIESLSGQRPLVSEAVMRLSDGRRVQILRLTPKPGELEVECRTLPR